MEDLEHYIEQHEKAAQEAERCRQDLAQTDPMGAEHLQRAIDGMRDALREIVALQRG